MAHDVFHGAFSRSDVVRTGFSRDPLDEGYTVLKAGDVRASGLLGHASLFHQAICVPGRSVQNSEARRIVFVSPAISTSRIKPDHRGGYPIGASLDK